MQTVSQPTAKRMVKVGWVGETHFIWVLDAERWIPLCEQQEYWKAKYPWLPAMSLDEVLADLPRGTILYKSASGYWAEVHGETVIGSEIHIAAVEAAAEVWLKRRVK